MKLKFSGQICEKYSKIKFHEISSSGSRVVARGLTDMTEITEALRSFAKVPKNVAILSELILKYCMQCYFWIF
jgi:hypothetical protein